MNPVKQGCKLLSAFRITLERCLFLEVSIERTFILSVDIDLIEQREGDVVSQRAEALNLIVGTRLLAEELVAREGQNLQTLVLVFLIKSFQAFVLRIMLFSFWVGLITLFRWGNSHNRVCRCSWDIFLYRKRYFKKIEKTQKFILFSIIYQSTLYVVGIGL